MAIETEVNAVILFDDDHRLKVRETPEQVAHNIAVVTNPHVPLAELHNEHGEPVLVNANQIRVVRPLSKGEGAVGF